MVSSRGRPSLRSLQSLKELAPFLLQVFSQLRSALVDAEVSLHLVEVSPALSRVQAETLTSSYEPQAGDGPVYLSGETASGLPVSWYHCLEDVPAGSKGSF